MENKVLYGADARKVIKEGVDLVANAVKVTLGAKGLNVMCVRDLLLPVITKDGVSVAKEVESDNPMVSAGASAVKQVANQTNEEVGDGTSSSSVLAQAIVQEADKVLNRGANAISIKKGLDLALISATENLKKISTNSSSLPTLKNIANISTNGDKEISGLVVDAIKKVGKNGTIKVEEVEETISEVVMSLGYEMDVPFANPEFITETGKFSAEFPNMKVLIYSGHLEDSNELNEAIKICTNENKVFEGLLIICDNISGYAQKQIIEFKHQGFNIMNVRSPSFGSRKTETLKDIATIVGAKVFSKDLGDNLKDVTKEDLGFIDKVVSDANKTVLIGGKGTKKQIEERVVVVNEQVKTITGGKKEKEFAKDRLSKLTKGVAVINVGGFSAVEKREKTDRVEDALCAVRACLEEGFVAGGGVTYIRLAQHLKKAKIDTKNPDERKGVEILIKALYAPFLQILENAGLKDKKSIFRSVDRNVTKVENSEYGYGVDLETGDFINLIDRGIIDPTKVARMVLQNAVSISSTFLTIGAITYNGTSIFKPVRNE